jgi:ATP-dependent Clp protease ATP-binding subunit ClpX
MAEQGIVFFDEFDKIISASNEGNKFKAASLQYEMLKMMEGGEIVIKGDGPADSAKSTVIDTKNILFLAAGSFYELETIVDKKSEHTTLGIHSSVGQPKVAYDWRDKADTGHLLTFGIIPELMGRFSQFVFTNPLTKADLLKIMYEPKNSLVGNYRALFRQDGVEVAFTEELLEAVVDEAILNKLGARGLRSGMGKRLEELSFNISDYKGKFVVLGPTGIQKVIEAEAKEPTKKTSKKVAVQG